jgi:solute carrier family 8 (sodium/calcium exchanger)
VITSQKNEFITTDETTGYKVRKTVPVWNPTMANLTLMAFGSSAPEILLNCIETIKTLDSTPSELGIAGIIGSAAFNFLVITGVSIASVEETSDERTEAELLEDDTPRGIKKIRDLGVFGVTGISSLLAYAWLWICLMDKQITLTEAIITFSAFFVLLALAFTADKVNAKRTKDRLSSQYGG